MISPGKQIGGYTMLRQIGQGAMGEVYVAESASDAARVAIKVFGSELSAKPKVLDRFFREARTTSQVRHAGLVDTLDCFVHEDQVFVVMELLEGESLGTYLRRAGALDSDLPFLLGIAGATAGAVGAVHAAGVIHRDLKPGNIYLHLAKPSGPDVTVKILDVGMARLSQEEEGPSQTVSGLLVGTPAYMSPEQCRGATGIDARSDIYSLGCVLYEALCGRPPFAAEGLGDLIIAHVSQTPEAPSKLCLGLSPRLNSLILALLAKNPSDRPQTMAEVGRTLRECARGMRIDLEGQPLRPRKPIRAVLHAGGDGVVKEPVIRRVRDPKDSAAPEPFPTPVAHSSEAPVAGRVAAAPDPVSQRSEAPSKRILVAGQAGRLRASEHPTRSQARWGVAVPPIPALGRVRAEPLSNPPQAGADRQPVVAKPGGTMLLEHPKPGGMAQPEVSPGSTSHHSSRPSGDSSVDGGGKKLVQGNAGGTLFLDPGGPSEAPSDWRLRLSDEAVGGVTTARLQSTGPGARTLSFVRQHARGIGIAVAAILVVLGLTLVTLPSDDATSPGSTIRRTGNHKSRSIRVESEGSQMVEIEIHGLLPDTAVDIDDQPATLPIRIPRGSDLHRIVLRPPGRPARTIEVDGTKDRTIELMVE
jgi:serine/threonine protein kinase